MAASLSSSIAAAKAANALVDQLFQTTQRLIEQLNKVKDNVELRDGLLKQARYLKSLLLDSPSTLPGCQLHLDNLRDHLRNCEELIQNRGSFVQHFITANDEKSRLVKLQEELSHAVQQACLSFTISLSSTVTHESRRARRDSLNPDGGVFIGPQVTLPQQLPPQAVTVRPDKDLVRIMWKDDVNEGDNVTGYEVEYDEEQELRVRTGKSEFKLTLGNPKVQRGGVYSIRVRAFNGHGPGPWSEPKVCALPLPPPTPSTPEICAVHMVAEKEGSDTVEAEISLLKPKEEENVVACLVELHLSPDSLPLQAHTEDSLSTRLSTIEEQPDLQKPSKKSSRKTVVVEAEVHEDSGASGPQIQQTKVPEEESSPDTGFGSTNPAREEIQLAREPDTTQIPQTVDRWERETFEIDDRCVEQVHGRHIRIAVRKLEGAKNHSYSFRVALMNKHNIISRPSTIVRVSAGEFVPGPPTGLVVVDYSHNKAHLAWQQPVSNAWAVHHYQVEYRSRTGDWEDVLHSSEQISCTVSSLQSRSMYCFRVCAVSRNGEKSSYSDEITKTTRYHPFIRGLTYGSIIIGVSLTSPVSVPLISIGQGLHEVDRLYVNGPDDRPEAVQQRRDCAFQAVQTTVMTPVYALLAPLIAIPYAWELAKIALSDEEDA